ncbi:MAG: hypothetical protein JRG82_10790 [Deltaproteobacteria bacterium]|nr:hypothetical protein [Deltaproteobacteria bacterium]
MTLPPIVKCIPALLCLAAVSGDVPVGAERVDMYPPEPAMWTPRNVVAGVTSVFGFYSHWYREKRVVIETVPADTELSLYYLRGNFQKRFERVDAPVVVELPSRIDSSSHDTFRLRVSKDGYLVEEKRFKVHKVPDRLLIELAPLPNSLTFLGQTHLGNRTTLTLRTTEEPQVRMAKGSQKNSFTMALTETANKLEVTPEISSGFIEGIEIAQLGEDLLLRVATTAPDLEVRSRASRDPVRREFVITLDLTPPGARLVTPGDISGELAAISFSGPGRCGGRFEGVLREELDAGAVSRAFRGGGSVTAYYREESMRKLGRLDTGRVHSVSGDTFRIGSPIEFEMAMQSAADIRGYFALLGVIARGQDDPETFLRSLLAPETSAADFESIYRKADRAYQSCA